MLLSCGQTMDVEADVDLDNSAASHVAILPSVSHLTSGQLLRRAANDKVRSAQLWREERLAQAPLPATLTGRPQTFGWTPNEKYSAALQNIELQKLLALPPEDQVRTLSFTQLIVFQDKRSPQSCCLICNVQKGYTLTSKSTCPFSADDGVSTVQCVGCNTACWGNSNKRCVYAYRNGS